MEQKEKHKVVVLGGGSVGKSALTIRYLQSKFIEDYDPTIEESYRKMVIVDDSPCMLEVLDTAGQEEYRSIRDQYLRIGEGFLLVFSIVSVASFNEIEPLLKSLFLVKSSKDIPILIVGNKLDLEEERMIPSSKGEDLAAAYNSSYIETSAMSGKNVDAAFSLLVRRLREWKTRKSLESNKGKDTGGKPAPSRRSSRKSFFCSLI